MARMPAVAERLLLEPLRNRIAVNSKDGSVLVYVPAGEFWMGSPDGEGKAEERPRHRVELSGYWIGVYAVTNAQYLRFAEATGHRSRVRDDEQLGYTGYRDAKRADYPMKDASWKDAMLYAKWAGCELASEAQWEHACRGPLGLMYPWGNAWDETKCRYERNRRGVRVYDYPGGVSGYGTYYQSGNVWEWCGDWYDDKYYGRSPRKDPRGPKGGLHRAARGGNYYDRPDSLRAASRCEAAPRYGGNEHIRGLQLRLGLRLVRAAS